MIIEKSTLIHNTVKNLYMNVHINYSPFYQHPNNDHLYNNYLTEKLIVFCMQLGNKTKGVLIKVIYHHLNI